MRSDFETMLEQLNDELIMMGALCERGISRAVKSLMTSDLSLAEKASAEEKEIDRLEKDIESLCLKLILRQQPVAGDLRLISAALKMITDMERIGDQAADIAEIVLSADMGETKNDIHISEMASGAVAMVTDSIEAYVKRDLSIAENVIKRDDVIDALFLKVRGDLLELIAADPSSGEEALDIMMIAKYLERIADHAVNIAEWVIFAVTGQHKELS